MLPVISRLVRLALVTAIVVAAALGLDLLTGIGSGTFDPSQLVYFTIQSNILVLLCYGFVLVRTLVSWGSARRVGDVVELPPLVMGAVMLAIAVTGLVYNLVLAPGSPDVSVFGVDPLGNLLVHTAVPTAVFVDWLVFADKRSLRWWAPFAWTLVPLAYFGFAVVRAQVGGAVQHGSRYPYFFIDADRFGWGQVLLNVVGLVVVFVALAYLVIGLGRLLERLTSSTVPAER